MAERRCAIRKLLLLACCACSSSPTTIEGQPPVATWLVVHVDPLPVSNVECTTEGLESCGDLVAHSWIQRTNNLDWLVNRWLETGRTLDMQLGPEASLGWSEDPAVTSAMVAALEESGTSDAVSRVADAAQIGRDALGALVSGGAGSLGVHVHAVLPDGAEGVWGSVAFNTPMTDENGTPEACRAWAGQPLSEVRAEMVERVVSYGVSAAAGLAEQVGAPLETFTGHLPRTMAGKIALLEDPDSLDPVNTTEFSDLFMPVGLGSAYSECLTVLVDHQPFEAWPADEEQALLAGEGPPVVPGARVVGSMAVHLGATADGAMEANGRRFIHQLLVWRYAALTGDEPRPWMYTFHEHLFDLYPGSPNELASGDRDVHPLEGQKYRQDLEGISSLVDAFASRGEWQGVSAAGGGVARWVMPREVDATGSGFSYGSEDAAPPDGLDRDAYPYLPLVAERLVNSHLACVGALDGVEIYGMLRCDVGWSWGDPQPGYGCSDASAPSWVYLLVPEGPTCLGVEPPAGLAAAVDDEELGAPDVCDGGLVVPMQGLLVEPSVGAWLPEVCGAWP